MLGLWGKPHLMTAFFFFFFINKVLLEHSYDQSFLYGSFCAGMAELLSGPLLKQLADPRSCLL